jgi:transposase-like protein
MAKKQFTTEQIINMLREAEVHLSQGTPIAQVCKKLGISEQSYYRWRKEYGGLRTDQAKKLREVLKENARLKKVVADLALDNDILREAASGNF